MTVKSIKIENFRNISEINILPSDGVNVIHGENAQGKTNILEAMWLFTGCKSFRGAKDRDFIKFGEKSFKNEIVFDDGTREKKASIYLGEGKKVTLNGVELSSTSELIGNFCAVVFSPSQLSLVKDGPSERRKFLDVALCQLKPKYAEYLKSYKHALFQRNIILKDLYYSTQLYDLLDSWDDCLARYAAVIIFERLKYSKLLSEKCEEIYAGISDNKESFSVSYSSFFKEEPQSIHDLYILTLDELLKRRKEDTTFKTTSIGPHRDDLELLINKKSARSFASQGQQRSAALALKLSEAKAVEEITGKTPIALLDDVMSELDEKRQDYILNNIDERQVFLTCCDPSQVMRMCKGKSFHIKNGAVFEDK